MINKLVVIINSLQVPKIKKILLYEMKFLVPNYSCLQNLWLRGYCPRSPFALSSVLTWICWTPPKKIPGYATGQWKVILSLILIAVLLLYRKWSCGHCEERVCLFPLKFLWECKHIMLSEKKNWGRVAQSMVCSVIRMSCHLLLSWIIWPEWL